MDPQKMIEQSLRLQSLHQQISQISSFASQGATLGNLIPPHKGAPTSNPPAVTPAIAAQLLPVASTPPLPTPTVDSNSTAQANNAANAAAAEQKRKRKRKGPPVKKACFHCKKSHLSCSNQRPCQRCQDRGLECYDAPTTQPAKKSRKAKSKNGTPEDNDDAPDSPITVPSTPNVSSSAETNHSAPAGAITADKSHGALQLLPSLTNLASQFPPPTMPRNIPANAIGPDANRLATQDVLKNTLMEFINRPTTPMTHIPIRGDRNGVNTPVNNLPPVPWSPTSPLGTGIPSSGVYFSPVVDNDILGGPAPSPLPLTPSDNSNHATTVNNNSSQQTSSGSSQNGASSFAVPQAPPNNTTNHTHRKMTTDDVISSSASSDTSPHQSENHRAESTSPENYDEIRPQLLYTEMRMMKDILLKQQDAIEKLLSAPSGASSNTQSQNSLVVSNSAEADESLQLKDIALAVMLKMNTAVSVWRRKDFILVKCNEAFRKLVRDTSAQRRLIDGTSTLHDLLLYAQDKSDVKPMLQLLLNRVINPDGAGETPVIYKFWAKSLLRDFSGEYVAMSSTFHVEQDFFWIEQVKVPFQSAFDDEFQINDDEIQPKTMDITTKQQVLEKVLRIMAYVEKKKNAANIFSKDV